MVQVRRRGVVVQRVVRGFYRCGVVEAGHFLFRLSFKWAAESPPTILSASVPSGLPFSCCDLGARKRCCVSLHRPRITYVWSHARYGFAFCIV